MTDIYTPSWTGRITPGWRLAWWPGAASSCPSSSPSGGAWLGWECGLGKRRRSCLLIHNVGLSNNIYAKAGWGGGEESFHLGFIWQWLFWIFARRSIWNLAFNWRMLILDFLLFLMDHSQIKWSWCGLHFIAFSFLHFFYNCYQSKESL